MKNDISDSYWASLFQKACKSIAKFFLGKAVTYVEKKKCEKEFEECGRFISKYEQIGTSEFTSDLAEVFSEENMRQLHDSIDAIPGFSFSRVLREELKKICSRNGVDVTEAEYFIDQFINMISIVMYQYDQEKSLQMFLGEFKEESALKMDALSGKIDLTTKLLCKIYAQSSVNKEIEIQDSKISIASEPVKENEKIKIEWKIKSVHVNGLFGNIEKRKEELSNLTILWKEERLKYPNWYITPHNKRQELRANTKGEELLQFEELAPLPNRFEFAYEFLWRYEKAMIPYSLFLQKNTYNIWKEMADTECWQNDEQKNNWFTMGLFFLREYREELLTDKWEKTYSYMNVHMDFEEDSQEKLQLEEIAMRFACMRISETIALINTMQIDKCDYSTRMRLCSYKAECGMFEQAYTDIGDLVANVQLALSECEPLDILRITYLSSVLSCSLQLYSYFVQANDSMNPDTYNQIREIHEEQIKYSEYYSYEKEKELCINGLLNWVDKKTNYPLFELNRETHTIFGESNNCIESYVFFRILENTGQPLHLKNVRLLLKQESMLIESIMDICPQIGWYLLMRSGHKNSIKKCITRKRLVSWDRMMKDDFYRYVYNALDSNLYTIKVQDPFWNGNIYTAIASSSIEILIRMASVATMSQQTELLLLMKKIIDSDAIAEISKLDEFIIGVMEKSNEECKASMINSLLSCSAQKRTHFVETGQIDPFDAFNGKELAMNLYQNSHIENYLIDNMFVIAGNSEEERKAMIARLGKLYEWGILSDEQNDKFAELLWSRRNAETGLPDLKNYYLVVYLRWPHPKQIDVKKIIQDYLVNEDWIKRFSLKIQGISGLKISYWDQIRLINLYMENGFWNTDQLEKIIQITCEYWESEKRKLAEDGFTFNFKKEMFIKEYREVLNALASFSSDELRCISVPMKERYIQMLQELRERGLSTLEAEVAFLDEDQKDMFILRVIDSLYEVQNYTVISGVTALQKLWNEHFDIKTKNYLFSELAKVIKARKQPGLLSFLTVAHNLFYNNTEKFPEEILVSLENALIVLEKQTDYSNETDEKELKQNIEIRCKCASLALQLYLYENDHKEGIHSEASLLWEKICGETEEFVEVKNNWIAS
ncbi:MULTISPECIES: hypothetical protein [unclassified Ruminococcus]|uniref:hypothetical protein n=1 Tax=unclassified Ruminococcus TaxID=2608920 RepID=UPI00319E0A06